MEKFFDERENTYLILKRQWDKKGKFTYKGLTWKKGVNDSGGEETLARVKEKFFETTIAHLADQFDELMINKRAYGFTLGSRGKRVYWFITPHSSSGMYSAVGYCADSEHLAGPPTWLEVNQKITIHYK